MDGDNAPTKKRNPAPVSPKLAAGNIDIFKTFKLTIK
jgi:hypothetical protein